MGEQKRCLVVYATGSGCTEDVARWIAEELEANGVTADVRPADDDPACAGYDAAIVGSGVRAGAWHKQARRWVVRNAEALRTMPVAFFTVGLKMAESEKNAAEVRGYTDALIQQIGLSPVEIGLFAGWSQMKRFTLPERLVLKALKAPDGDFRDEAAVRAWTSGLLDRLGML
ncbi:flavodoxin domain-containing protein [Coriobacteriia bacterium Es71-Z0120]|uniref:flavodoxin domain-containing protein n=1 Tax=Parvivirga hydrogeniphila TaxID=2939460 RepID=UPI002260BE88|nr:flavodoxin domain-containing protein [Parvivirga hydrogeniphila]MCL4078059.1 flavodoxin domain-containing protein [Parvivirga hydrogeniphila]